VRIFLFANPSTLYVRVSAASPSSPPLPMLAWASCSRHSLAASLYCSAGGLWVVTASLPVPRVRSVMGVKLASFLALARNVYTYPYTRSSLARVSADGGYHSPDRTLAVLTIASMSFLHSSGGGGVNVFLSGHASGGSLIHGSPSWYGVPGSMSLGNTVGLVPMSMSCTHYNGQAERLIGLLKRCLEGTLNSHRLTLGELNTVVAEATQMVNSRPIAKNTGDPETGGPITPLHLQQGRATVEVPSMKFEEVPHLTQRLQFIEETKRQFWKKWMQQVFSGRMLNHKWTKTVRNVAVGDIVYLAEAENDDPTYRLGKVVEANPGEDGCVRTMKVQYTNPGKSGGMARSPPKITTRPIHKVAVVVPAGYTFEDDVCDSEVGSRGRKQGLGTSEEAEVTGAPKREPAKAKVEEPGTGGVQPAVCKRRGRPKKSERPTTV
jgi:hypothetical protein